MKYTSLLFTFFALCSTHALSQGYSQDTGKISQFHAQAGGAVAVLLDGGFPNATSSNQCVTAQGWAGEFSLDPVLKSALLAAYTAGKTVTITVQGCAAGGGWFKIIDIYLR